MIDGKRLRDLREQRGYSRRELAEKIDVGERQIVRYEQGESDATGDVLARIATVLGVSADYLIGLTDHAAPQLESDWTPDEVAIIKARRRGDYKEAMKTLLDDG